MPPRVYSVYVGHIREAADRAREFVAGMSYEQFAADTRTVYATVRALEIVGEAARLIPEDVRAMEPAIPWRAMAGMRDRMIHRYEEVDLTVVWDAVQQELPALFPALARLQQTLEAREDEEWERLSNGSGARDQ
jgi:uncharacterized protein with HEPN domain